MMLLNVTLLTSSYSMDHNDVRIVLKEATHLTKKKEFDKAISRLKILLENIEDDPRLSRSYYRKISSLIRKTNMRKKRWEETKQRDEKRNASYERRASKQNSSLETVDSSQLNDRRYVRNMCKKAEPNWPYYVCNGREECKNNQLRWMKEADANLEKIGLPENKCKNIVRKKEAIVDNLESSRKYEIRSMCQQVIHGPAQYMSERGLSYLDNNIKDLNLDINLCPRVKKHRASTIEKIAFEKKMAAKRAEDNKKLAQEARAKEKAKLQRQIKSIYDSGIFIKLSTSDYKRAYNKREDKFDDLKWNIVKWEVENKKFLENDKYKLKSLKLWQRVYLNYMTAQLCDRNQGSYELISDMSELRDKMGVIVSAMPIYIDPDALWDSVQNGGVYGMIAQMDGLLDDRDFRIKMGRNCKQQQTILRMTYKEFSKEFTTDAVKTKKRKISKRDF